MDTIAFVLTGKELTIKKPEFFKPDYRSTANPQLLRTKFLLNKIKSLNNKIRITAIPRYADGTVTVNHTLEVSLPKLIKGNNIEEIDERHWEYIQRAIVSDLAKVGVEINVPINQLRVTKVHIGKNILLPAHIYLSEEIEKLSKLAPPPHFELSVVQYHPGKMVKMHSRLIEVVFYDKTQEVLQDKRIDKEFKQFITEQKLNIFRIEVRLNKKQNIISVLKQLGIPCDQITFEFLYNSRLWKQVILLYLTKVFLSQKYMLTNKEETDILRRLLLTDEQNLP